MKKDKKDKPANSLQLLRRILSLYLRPYLSVLGLAALCMFVSSGMTGALAYLMKPMIDKLFEAHEQAALIPVCIAVMTVFVLRGIANYGNEVSTSYIGQRIVADIQSQLYAHLLGADLAFFHKNPPGQLMSRMTSDISVMRYTVSEALTGMGRSTLTLIFLVFVMFRQDWRMAIASFIVFPLASLLVANLGKRLRRNSASTQAEMAHFSSVLAETFQGIRHVKAYGMEGHEQERTGGIIENLFRLALKSVRISSIAMPITETLSGIAIVVVLLYGGGRVVRGETTTGALFSFITAFLMAYDPMKRMAKLNGVVQMGLAASERVMGILDMPPAILDKLDAVPIFVTHPCIRFENVNFWYEDGTHALKDFSLEVPEGKTVALVGASGSGKSTVLNLIPRFYDVQEGRVLIDSMDIRNATIDSLRGNLAFVSQEIAIFDDTVRANIAYGRAGASEEEIIEAAKAAAAHGFIMEMQNGYDTQVGAQGVKLSGGQRQRIAIARAMLRNAPILLLDEATSALDTESERLVQAALRRLRAGRTTLVVAHRLSTIRDADVICALDEGRLVETGNHEALLQKGGVYARLYGLQLSQQETEKP
ncbi:MAG TPA: ABC transporter permease [Rhodospirillaceae bacterium]|nr:MAG: ABC transporter permease [Alphaproteobacteria bacterium GWF2_58_20]HAU29380.1 ABC transporter permease [Rhodospirillaceae bacterium]